MILIYSTQRPRPLYKVRYMKPEITYINPDPPGFDPPRYTGQSYEAMVPATLDIAERAWLAVNALTETTDPDYDYEIYWIVDLLAEEPAMYLYRAKSCGRAGSYRHGIQAAAGREQLFSLSGHFPLAGDI